MAWISYTIYGTSIGDTVDFSADSFDIQVLKQAQKTLSDDNSSNIILSKKSEPETTSSPLSQHGLFQCQNLHPAIEKLLIKSDGMKIERQRLLNSKLK